MEISKPLTPEQLEDARRLKALYESKKKQLQITQYTLAYEMGISQGAVGHYLNGRNPLNVKVASIFAHLLNVSVNDFSPSIASTIAEQASSLKNGFVENKATREGSITLSTRPLTKKQIELLETFEALPDDKKERFLSEMKNMKAHYDAYFKQRLKQTHNKTN